MADPNNPPPQSKYAPTTPGTTATKDKTKRPLESYSPSELRIQFRKGNISEGEWEGELVARGESTQSAADAIAAAKQVGVSQSGTNKGKLTPAEQAAVNAVEYRKPDSLDSWESPARAAEGLSSVSPEGDAAAIARRDGSSGSGTGSTAAAKKLPLTPEEEFLKKQADKVAAQELASRMQRQAEDQYILQSGGKVQRNPETGGLESQTADSSGKYSAVTPHTYDPSTGQITQEAPVGWKNNAYDQGNSLNPEGAWWQNADAQTIENNRRLNRAELGQAIGHEPTAADLLSPPGGTFALGGGDANYRANLSALAKTGKILPGMGNESVVNKFGPNGSTPVTLNYGQKVAPQAMNGQEREQYLALGDFAGSSTGQTLDQLTGGRTLGEIQNQNAYGSDPAPDGAREAVMANINSGKIFDFDALMKKYGVKAHALGDVDLAGAAALPQMDQTPSWLTNNADTSAILGNRGVRGGEAAYGWNSDDGINYNWQQNDYARRLQQGTTENRPQPPWWLIGSTPGNNFAPGLAGEDYSRLWNGLPTSIGKQAPNLRRINGSYSEYAYADGGVAGAGMDEAELLRRRRLMADGSQGSNMPAGWYQDPANGAYNVQGYAQGGSASTAGPTGLVDLQTGQMKGVYGEDGPEAAVFVPLSKPAKPGLPSMVQQTMLGGSGANTGTAMMPPGPTPTEMLRQQAKLLRPRVPVKVGG